MREAFEKAGLTFTCTSIDDVVVKMMKGEGGAVWACMNYDGDIFSDFLAAGFGSTTLVSSVLLSPDGAYLYETAHGTIPNHFERHQRAEPTYTNPIATIYAWKRALARRAELDGTPAVKEFAERLEQAVTATVEAGVMPKDLLTLCHVANREPATTETFIQAVAKRLG